MPGSVSELVIEPGADGEILAAGDGCDGSPATWRATRAELLTRENALTRARDPLG